MTVLSSLAEASRFPSGLNATLVTPLLCPFSVRDSLKNESTTLGLLPGSNWASLVGPVAGGSVARAGSNVGVLTGSTLGELAGYVRLASF